ncbi:MAG: MopE-related protein, partial [Myxococcota bacterium]
TEVCDSKDNDCDTVIDDNDSPVSNQTTWYQDSDGDTYGNSSVSTAKCTKPTGYVAQNGDCNDNDSTVNPGASEELDGEDDNCNGVIDEGTEGYDDDGDGYAEIQGDCDDADPNTNPDEPELEDGIDNDCDGEIDEGYDDDEDSYSVFEGDCNDNDATVFPGAPELCDELDNDCNSTVDDFIDNDEDGFNSCDDCDDNANTTYPSAPELCDGSDNNCDGEVPSSGPSSENDDDLDGFRVCDDDCDDSDQAMFPDNEEVCDEKDNDCNGTADDDASDEETYFADGDADSNGDPRSTITGCEVPPGYVINSEDCDDADASIYKDASVQCDGLDHDCDGTADYLNEDFDADNDSFLSGAICSGLPSDYQLDCNDGNNQIYPGAEEKPGDAIDNNCDGELSEGYTAVAVSGCSCSTEGQAPTGRTAAAGYGLALVALFQVWRRRARIMAQKGERA